jgi:transcription elongation GreA/GreB family factor
MGKALLGRRVGDEVEVAVPAGVLKVRVAGIK